MKFLQVEVGGDKNGKKKVEKDKDDLMDEIE